MHRDNQPPGKRRTRWRGLIWLASQRVRARITTGVFNRMSVAIGIVAMAVALLVIVTGVSFGLAAQTTVHGEDIDYWIVPETGTTLTTIVSVEGPQLGDTHTTAQAIQGITGVHDTTPVLIEIVQIGSSSGPTGEYVLGIGVIPSDDPISIAGISTRAFTSGDPYFNDGSYDGEFTGEVILSPAAAQLLNVNGGETVQVSSPATARLGRSFTVTAISESGVETARGQVPVAIFHLSELQAYTGAQRGDQADQILVRTNAPGVKPALERVYPDAIVVARAGLNTRQVVDSDLPLAMSLTAFLVGIVIAGLFLATSMGLMVEADRRELAILAALGFPQRARLALVGLTTVTITIFGGIIGVGLGFVGIAVLNLAVTAEFGAPAFAMFEPLFIPYGIGVALITGLLAAPYPIVLASRLDTLEELRR